MAKKIRHWGDVFAELRILDVMIGLWGLDDVTYMQIKDTTQLADIRNLIQRIDGYNKNQED